MISEARNSCNDEKDIVFQKMKSLFEKDYPVNLDPTKLYKATNDTLNYIFPTTLPFFGTLLSKDAV
jgi:catabolite regulation protein CreA